MNEQGQELSKNKTNLQLREWNMGAEPLRIFPMWFIYFVVITYKSPLEETNSLKVFFDSVAALWVSLHYTTHPWNNFLSRLIEHNSYKILHMLRMILRWFDGMVL